MKCATPRISHVDEKQLLELMIPPEIDVHRLITQLSQLSIVIQAECCDNKPTDATEVAKALGTMNRTVRLLFSEVSKFLSLIISLPTSVGSAERTFSCLRRIKAWLRSTMSQARLNHLAVMSIHNEGAVP